MHYSIADGKEGWISQPGGQAAERHSNLPSDTHRQTLSHLLYYAQMQMDLHLL